MSYREALRRVCFLYVVKKKKKKLFKVCASDLERCKQNGGVGK